MATRLREYCLAHAHPVPETRGQLARLVFESIAASYRNALTDLQRVTGKTVGTIHLVGGGSRNRLLCQLAADACRVPVVAGPAEATAFGNLLIQARALGDLPPGVTLREVAAHSSALTVYPPTFRPV
jgi:rhamnulokinase